MNECACDIDEKFRTIFDKAAIGIATVSLDDFRIMSCNPALQTILGYDENELLSKTLTDITHPDDIEQGLAQIDNVISGRIDHFHTEKRYIRKDGRIIWGHLTGAVVRDAFQKPLYAIGMVEDITERKHAEEALRQSEDQLRLALSSAKMGFWQVYFRTGEHVWDPTGAALLGLPSDTKLSNDAFLSAIHPDDRERTIQLIETAIAEHRDYEAEFRIVWPDGSEHWIRDRGRCFYDESGNADRILGVAIDITERKQAEEAMRESREDLNRAQAVARTGSWRLKVAQNLLFWSDETYRMFGKPQNTPLTYEAFIETVHPEDREYVDTKWNAALRGEPYDIEHRIVVNGQVKWVRERAELEFDREGHLLGGFGTVQEITDRKKIEQEQKALLNREQHIASTLQQALVPPNVPKEINGYKFATAYQSALKEAEIGGDFYDVFDLGDGRVCIMIGDVAGKGLRAAIRVAASRYAIRSYAFIESRPSRILTLANESLCCDAELEHDMLTAFLALVDTRVGSVVFSNAGHEPPILVQPDGRIRELYVTGVPLGVFNGIAYSEGTCRLEPGSRIVMVTDGIPEAHTSDVECFGKQRLIDFVRENSQTPLQELVDGLLKAATDYAGGELQDDAAIVAIEMCVSSKS